MGLSKSIISPLLLLLLLLLFCSLAHSAPPCDPNSFCFSPSENVKITIENIGGDKIDMKYWSRSENINNVGNVYLYQNAGREVRMRCDPSISKVELSDGVVNLNSEVVVNKEDGGAFSCHATVGLDNFNKTNQFFVKMDNSPPSEGFSLLKSSSNIPTSEGLTKQQRRQFSKAHAILMLLGWLFFVPTGFLFVRLGKDIFKDQTLLGGAVWFQIHRGANFMGVVCICASMLCIFISQQWTWKGTGSGSKYWTEVHTDLGVISTVLAVAQPINSLFRCGPTHSKRIIFNWAHRMVGITSYTLAITTILIAAINFKKIWNEPVLEIVLLALPTVLCIAASIGFPLLENERFRNKVSYGKNNRSDDIRLSSSLKRRSTASYKDDVTPLVQENLSSDSDSEMFDENAKPTPNLRLNLVTPHVLRIPVIFWAIGVFFASTVALSLLVVNGYKNV